MFQSEKLWTDKLLCELYLEVMYNFSNMAVSQELRSRSRMSYGICGGPLECDACCAKEQAIAERMGWAPKQTED